MDGIKERRLPHEASPKLKQRSWPRSNTRVLRIACHAALLAILAAILTTWAISKAGVCPRFDEAAIECVSPVYEAMASGALTVLIFAVFGLPLSLPLVGGSLVFLAIAVRKWWGGRQAAQSAR